MTPFLSLLVFQPLFQSTVVEGPVVPGWEVRHDVPATTDDRFEAVVVHATGHAFACGTCGAADRDLVVAASDASSASFLWTVRLQAGSGAQEEGSSIATCGQRVLAGGSAEQPNGEGSRALLAGLDASSGAVLWQNELDPVVPPVLDETQGVRRIVVSPDESVAFALVDVELDSFFPEASPPDRLVAFDPIDGSLVWSNELPSVNSARALALSPDGVRIVVVGQRGVEGAFGGVERDVVAQSFSAEDGAFAWFEVLAEDVSGSFGSGVAFTPDGDDLVVTAINGTKQVFGLSALDGSVQWSLGQEGLDVGAVAVGSDGLAYLGGSLDGNAAVWSVASDTGSIQWSRTGLPAGGCTDLEVFEPAGSLVASFTGTLTPAPDAWYVEAIDSGDGSLLWSVYEDAGDALEDAVLAVAIDAGSATCSLAGTRNVLGAGGQAVLAEVQLSDGTSLGESAFGCVEPADQLVQGTSLSSDGATAFSAGARRLGSPEPSLGPGLERGAWVSAHRTGTGELLWESILEGDGSTDFNVVGVRSGAIPERLFLAGAFDESRAHVTALDAASGALDWQSPIELHSPGTILSAIDVASGSDRVFATTYASPGSDAAVLALDASSGSTVWSSTFTDILSIQPPSLAVDPTGARVCFVGTREVSASATTDAFVSCHDALSGALLWSSTYDLDGLSEAWDSDDVRDAEFSPDGGSLFLFGRTRPDPDSLSSTSFSIRVDALSGSVDWISQYEIQPGQQLVPKRLALSGDGGRFYGLSSSSDSPGAFQLLVEARDPLTGEQVWSSPVPTGQVGSDNGFDLVVSADGTEVLLAGGANGLAADADGLTVALDAETGTILWKAVLSGSGPIEESTRSIELDPDGRNVLVASQSSLDPAHRDLVLQRWELPSLTALPAALSVAAGGTQAFQLSGGAASAGDLGLVLGTFAGTQPGVVLAPDIVLPLVPDAYTTSMLLSANQGPFVGTLGVLDDQGHTSAALVLPQGTSGSLVGLVAHHAWLGIDLARASSSRASPLRSSSRPSALIRNFPVTSLARSLAAGVAPPPSIAKDARRRRAWAARLRARLVTRKF